CFPTARCSSSAEGAPVPNCTIPPPAAGLSPAACILPATSTPRLSCRTAKCSSPAAITRIAAPFLTSAELYNPASGTWTTTGGLHTARIYDTMMLLQSGQVLVAGGYNTTSTINIL